MKKHTIFLATIIALSVNLQTFAEPQQDFVPKKEGRHGKFMQQDNNGKQMKQGHKGKRMHLGQKLNLTEEQRAKADKMREQARSQMKPLIEKMKSEIATAKKMRQEGASEEQMKAQREKIKALKEQMHSIIKGNFAKFEGILTPEQKETFAKIKAQRKQMMEKHRKEGFGKGKEGFGHKKGYGEKFGENQKGHRKFFPHKQPENNQK